MYQLLKILNFKFLFYLLFLFVVLIFIYNIFFYTPVLGYDGEAHFAYVDHLARYLPKDINLPSEVNTREYFNPPLPYLFPALIQVVCRNIIESDNLLRDCQPVYGIFTQIFQMIVYFFILLINMKTLKKINNSEKIKITSYKEIGGPKGKEPTRYGDWEKNGRCSDF